jgi:hypothetical protein
MKIVIWGREEELIKKFFDSYKFNEDEEDFDQIGHLIKTLEKNNNIIVPLHKILNFDDIDLYIFIDFPNLSNKFVKKAFDSKKYNFLITFENKLICPNNFNIKYLSLFNKVFTWNDELVDNKKYFKYLMTYSSKPLIADFEERNKLCCMISMNKVINFNKSLYKKRLDCIKWFENNFYWEFDLYGMNWDKYYFPGPKIIRILNRVNILTKILSYNFKCYKGPITGSFKDKLEILKKYKFSIAFENAENIQGYVSEKIFHCFFALTIPIYLGASNINKYVPKECFIDMRDFNNFYDLYLYIKKMDKITYENYIDNIKCFLASKKYEMFTNKYSSTIVLNEIKKLSVNE